MANKLSNLVSNKVKAVNTAVNNAESKEQLIQLTREEFLSLESCFPELQEEFFKIDETETTFLDVEKSVLNVGIIHKPVVKRVDGKLKIVTGHRKQRMVLRNPDHEAFDKITCEETFDILEICKLKFFDSNIQGGRLREDMDLIKIIEIEKEEYKKLEAILGRKFNINKEIASKTGKSKKTVERYDNITTLIPEFRELFENGNWGITKAHKIGQLSEFDQRELYNLMGAEIAKKTENEIKMIKNNLASKTDEYEKLEKESKELADKVKELEMNINNSDDENGESLSEEEVQNLKDELLTLQSNIDDIADKKADLLLKDKYGDLQLKMKEIENLNTEQLKKLKEKDVKINELSSNVEANSQLIMLDILSKNINLQFDSVKDSYHLFNRTGVDRLKEMLNEISNSVSKMSDFIETNRTDY